MGILDEYFKEFPYKVGTDTCLKHLEEVVIYYHVRLSLEGCRLKSKEIYCLNAELSSASQSGDQKKYIAILNYEKDGLPYQELIISPDESGCNYSIIVRFAQGNEIKQFFTNIDDVRSSNGPSRPRVCEEEEEIRRDDSPNLKQIPSFSRTSPGIEYPDLQPNVNPFSIGHSDLGPTFGQAGNPSSSIHGTMIPTSDHPIFSSPHAQMKPWRPEDDPAIPGSRYDPVGPGDFGAGRKNASRFPFDPSGPTFGGPDMDSHF